MTSTFPAAVVLAVQIGRAGTLADGGLGSGPQVGLGGGLLGLPGGGPAGDVRIVDPPPLVLELDQGRVAQSLLNLVRNAVQHTPEGTFVEVSATAVGTTARIRVADRGPGIPDNLKDRAFDAFVTSRREGSQRRSGLGLTW